MAYAVAADVEQIWAKELSTEETAMVTRRLEQAERIILRRIPNLVALVTAGTIVQQDVIDVESDAVLRVLKNPEGLSSETDGSYSYMLSRESADSSLRITAEEWKILGVPGGKMFGIMPALVMPT